MPTARSARSTCATAPTLPAGYSRAGTSATGTELTEPVGFYLRGEEYSAQIEHFVEPSARAASDGNNGFQSAAETDRVIAMMIADAARAPRLAPRAKPSTPVARRQRRRRFRRLDGAAARAGASSTPGGDPDGQSAVRRQPVLRRQPHVGGEGARAGDALPDARRRHRRARRRLRRGRKTFMCTTHDRIGEICDHVRAEPDATRIRVLPLHAVRPQVRERGDRGRHARRGQAFLPEEGLSTRRSAAGRRWRRRTSRASPPCSSTPR